jgi:hypothetical protein
VRNHEPKFIAHKSSFTTFLKNYTLKTRKPLKLIMKTYKLIMKKNPFFKKWKLSDSIYEGDHSEVAPIRLRKEAWKRSQDLLKRLRNMKEKGQTRLWLVHKAFGKTTKKIELELETSASNFQSPKMVCVFWSKNTTMSFLRKHL